MCMHQISPTHILNKSNKMLLITRILHYQTGFTTKQTKSSPCQSCTPCVCQPGMAACKSCRMLSLFHQPGVQTHSSAKGCLCCQNFLCGTEKLSKFQMAKTLKSLPLTNLHFLFKLPFPRPPLFLTACWLHAVFPGTKAICILAMCTWLYNLPTRAACAFSRWQRWDRSRVSGGKSCSQFPISLFLVQCKCTSMGLDVYLTPHALIQRGQEIGAWMLLLWQMGMCWIAHIVRQGALGLEVVLTSLSLSGFCLELQTQRAVQTVTLSCPSAHLCYNLLFVTVSAVATKAAFKENCFGPATALIFSFQKK